MPKLNFLSILPTSRSDAREFINFVLSAALSEFWPRVIEKNYSSCTLCTNQIKSIILIGRILLNKVKNIPNEMIFLYLEWLSDIFSVFSFPTSNIVNVIFVSLVFLGK